MIQLDEFEKQVITDFIGNFWQAFVDFCEGNYPDQENLADEIYNKLNPGGNND